MEALEAMVKATQFEPSLFKEWVEVFKIDFIGGDEKNCFKNGEIILNWGRLHVLPIVCAVYQLTPCLTCTAWLSSSCQ